MLWSVILSKTVQWSRVYWRVMPCNEVYWFKLYCTLVQPLQSSPSIAVQYSTLKCSTVQWSTVQNSTVLYSAVQYSTVQCTMFFISILALHSFRLKLCTVKHIVQLSWVELSGSGVTGSPEIGNILSSDSDNFYFTALDYSTVQYTILYCTEIIYIALQ